jgi:hypothetical protein
VKTGTWVWKYKNSSYAAIKHLAGIPQDNSIAKASLAPPTPPTLENKAEKCR